MDEPVDPGLRHLEQSVALFMMFEEAMINAFAEAATSARQAGCEDEAAAMDDIVRRHRKGLVQHRALIEASGLADLPERYSNPGDKSQLAVPVLKR